MKTTKPEMDAGQFKALAQLLRLRGGVPTDAARMVLVNGTSIADTARALAVTYDLVAKAVTRARKGQELAHLVTHRAAP